MSGMLILSLGPNLDDADGHEIFDQRILSITS